MKFLEVQGRAGDAIKRLDWGAHPLGPADGWSPALRAMLYTVLSSAAPKMLLWGEELFTFYNSACAELIDPILCPGIGESFPLFRADTWPALRPAIEGAIAGASSVELEYRAPARTGGGGGGGIYQLCFSPVLDEDRAISGVMIDIFDVSARKRLEESLLGEIAMLNDLFSTTPVLIAHAAAPDFVINYANAAFTRLFEPRPLIGRTIAEALADAAESGLVAIVERVITTGEPCEGREVPIDLGGPRRYLDFACHPVRAADGSVGGILFSGYDATDRRKARNESEGLRHQLLHASHMSAMGTMAVTIAHELNQPLTAAANYLASAEYGLAGVADSEDHGMVTAAREQLFRASRIVKGMRSLVSGGPTRSDAFNLEKSIGRAVELLRASGELADLALEVDVARDACRAAGDDVQVEQVLVNILRNAAQASATGHHRVARITTRRSQAMIEVRIRDWGPGIEPERLETLFTAMQESRKGGLGVGLSLCRTIIGAHGGEISARNCPDGGAEFLFTLPVETEEEELDLFAARPRPQGEPAADASDAAALPAEPQLADR